MTASLLNTVYLGAAFLVLFGSAEWMYHKTRLKCEFTRKYVHIFTGIITLLFPPLLGNHWFVLFLCGSFFLILMLSLRFNMLPSINNVDRKSRGSILYPITIYCCFLVYQHQDQYLFFYIPMLTLALADPVAVFMGKKYQFMPYTTFGNQKTISGSLGFFITAFLVSLCMMYFLEQMPFSRILITSAAVALFTTSAEAISHKGYDNITIPAAAIITLLLLSKLWG